jgi:hypothetical protein
MFDQTLVDQTMFDQHISLSPQFLIQDVSTKCTCIQLVTNFLRTHVLINTILGKPVFDQTYFDQANF